MWFRLALAAPLVLAGAMAAAAPAKAPPAAAPPKAAPPKAAPNAAPLKPAPVTRDRDGAASPARERQRACGAEWRSLPAAEKTAKGPTWPQFYSKCVKRLKSGKP